VRFLPSKHKAVVTVWQTDTAIEYEKKVDDLKALYEACRGAPPSRLVRITLVGPEGEVSLQFASYIRKG
jgi:hypothetical protein